jgi:predicted nucleotidyltransferase
MPEVSLLEDKMELVVGEFVQIAQEAGTESMLVGACARNLFLRGKSGASTPRRTQDVDFAVSVDSWDGYRCLRERLAGSSRFALSGKEGRPQCLIHWTGIEIDLVPFGGVASPEGVLTCWPDEFLQQMNVSGFDEALRTAESVEVGGRAVRVVTPEAFVVLKLFAWSDRPDRTKDAQDLAYLLREYANLPGKMDPLWEPPNLDIIERVRSFDRQVVQLLGRNIARIFQEATLRKTLRILEREIEGPGQQLARQMRPQYDFESAIEALSDLSDGMREVR